MTQEFKVALSWTQHFAGHVVISAETLDEAKERAPTLFHGGEWPAFTPEPIDPEVDPDDPPVVKWADLTITSSVGEDDFAVDDDKTTELNTEAE